jgi:FixJ family two-component response regulator
MRAARVYVIDDDSSARKGLARLLRTAGYDAKAFASATEFLAELETDAGGCIILDARMPGLSGPELHAELNARDVHLPLIFVTADDDAETKKKALDMKAAGFFRKPIDATALLDAIEWALKSRGAA